MQLTQEKTFQLPESRKQQNSAADHFSEGGEDGTATATAWTATQNN